MEFKQYIHNKGQQGLLQDQIIRELHSEIETLANIISIKDDLLDNADELIKQHEKVIKIQEEAYKALQDFATKQPSFWENAMSKKGAWWK